MRIAVLEDDPDHAAHLALLMEGAGHSVQRFDRGRSLLAQLARDSFDLIVLDWALPDISGFDVLRSVRAQLAPRTPVLFVTHRDSEADVVQALEGGADDYIVKPPRERELLSRIRAIARRGREGEQSRVIEVGPYKLDLERREATCDGRRIDLTQREFDVAAFFFRNPGKVVSRAHIMESLWGKAGDINTRVVDTHVSRVRTSLGLSAERGVRLVSIYGYGYRLEARPEAQSE